LNPEIQRRFKKEDFCSVDKPLHTRYYKLVLTNRQIARRYYLGR
jgi:hypothetical protein